MSYAEQRPQRQRPRQKHHLAPASYRTLQQQPLHRSNHSNTTPPGSTITTRKHNPKLKISSMAHLKIPFCPIRKAIFLCWIHRPTMSSRTFPNRILRWTKTSHRHWIEQWKLRNGLTPDGRILPFKRVSVSCWNTLMFCIRRKFERRLLSEFLVVIFNIFFDLEKHCFIDIFVFSLCWLQLDNTRAGEDHCRCNG